MNNNSSKQVLLSVIGVAILVVAVVGVSFAFFNYSRTGTEVNGLTVGTINFTGNVSGTSLSNAFPVSATTAAEATESTDDVAVFTVTITGNTTYANGIDFSVTAVPEDNSLRASLVTSQVSYTGLTGVTINEEATALKAAGETVLVAGNIPNTANVTNGVITIKLFVDSAKVLITDTASDPGTQAIINEREVVTTGAWNAKKYSFKINIWATQGAAPATGA